ncbi:hypothetical protein [Marinobacterium sediminicola]|uniref:Uncharacterized protein n=1 Tax=Marinobacterium sediminicola TaxID=518898 RepID=A0ABY1RXZ6_9GAMM|nr:hypothetical protein [Marinobacterium sediminicola]ULG68577.1 hypothetical protein LN244_12855 [Marinobacterium sediminicola]SMR73095.1 hypothetical protein SAMN04487964_10336 [Marinobacterium sediminicola]
MQTFKMLGTGLLCLACLNTSVHAETALGTVAIYSDGDVEKLVAYDNGYPVWEDVRKRRFTHASTPCA